MEPESKLACRRCFTFDLTFDGKCKKCKSSFYTVPIDIELAPVIREMWENNLFTDNCCSGHVEGKKFYAYILFPSNYALSEWLLTIKEDLETKFRPVEIKISDRGFTELCLRERFPGNFSKKKRESSIEQFKKAALYLLELYKTKGDQTNGS